jgi:hypothetical protein
MQTDDNTTTVPGDAQADDFAELLAEEKPAEQATTTPGQQAADTVQTQAADTLAGQQAPEGFDKALQKVQQDLANVTRLLERQGQGEQLTAKEQKVVAEAPRKLDAIRKAITDKKFDVFDQGTELGEALVELADHNESLKKLVADQQAALEELRVEQSWKMVTEQYPGVNVAKVWETAQKNAWPYRRFGDEAYQARADELFHSIAQNTLASIEAKKNGGGKPAETKPSAAPTPITNQGGRVTVTPGQPVKSTAPASQEDAEMKAMLDLVSDE